MSDKTIGRQTQLAARLSNLQRDIDAMINKRDDMALRLAKLQIGIEDGNLIRNLHGHEYVVEEISLRKIGQPKLINPSLNVRINLGGSVMTVAVEICLGKYEVIG